MKLHHSIFLVSCSIFILSSCSVSKQISKQANTILINDTAISKGHIGISIYEPATGKYLYKHDADKYFIPSSNTKLFTLYAGMKYLGDSLVGMKVEEHKNTFLLIPTADPTLLHRDFKKQPVYDFLLAANKELCGFNGRFRAIPYGLGWAWDDYSESFMTERSELPVFGNVISFWGSGLNFKYAPKAAANSVKFDPYSGGNISTAKRDIHENNFIVETHSNKNDTVLVPFVTSAELSYKLLSDVLHKNIIFDNTLPHSYFGDILNTYIIYSRPSDSLFKPMMFNSDNFFAEQTLLMVSNEKLGYMSDEDIIDTLLRTDLKNVPQKPRWVDGSGLSRYNLFTPSSFIYILDKMKTEFGIERLKVILPTGGQGTLKNYFLNDAGFVYAKTGTMSNNSSVSGFVITKKGKLLIFSMIANGYQSGVTPIRKAMEHFIQQIRENY